MPSLADLLQESFSKADAGDLSALFELGLAFPLIRKIQNAPVKKRNHFCKLGGTYLSRVLHQKLSTLPCQKDLEAILLYVDRADLDDSLHDELLRQRATQPMMWASFGMPKDEFTARRKLLKVSDKGGRSQRLSHSQEAAVLNSWSKSGGLPLAQRFLRVAKETKLDLKSSWPVLELVLGTQESQREKKLNGSPRRALRRPRQRPLNGKHDDRASLAVL